MRTIREIVDHVASRHPEREFLRFVPDDRRLTFGALRERVILAARHYASLGLDPGERVGLLLGNGPDLVVAFLGALYGGFVASPLNPALTDRELAELVRRSGARLLVTDRPRPGTIPGSLPVLAAGVTIPGAAPLLATSPGSFPPGEPAPDDPAMLLYTSGTTGPPKGALLTHRNLVVNTGEVAAWLGLGADDRFLCIMPLFHVNGLVLMLTTPLRLGATMILEDRFHASSFWETVETTRPTVFSSVATMLARLLERDDVPSLPGRTSVRFALCGSAPVPVHVMKEFERRFGVPVVEGYGLTECTCRATLNPPDRIRPGSIGLPIGNEIRIADDEGRELPAGEAGEIRIRGANVMSGYLDDPEATASAITPDGWLRTGDLGTRDADGYFRIVGRRSDMILRGGENVYPREIEEVLHAHPAVREAAVYGVPDAVYGERVAAAIALRDGMTTTADELRRHCSERLARFKCPDTVVVRPDLPKGPTGKILKTVLRSAHATDASSTSPGNNQPLR